VTDHPASTQLPLDGIAVREGEVQAVSVLSGMRLMAGMLDDHPNIEHCGEPNAPAWAWAALMG